MGRFKQSVLFCDFNKDTKSIHLFIFPLTTPLRWNKNFRSPTQYNRKSIVQCKCMMQWQFECHIKCCCFWWMYKLRLANIWVECTIFSAVALLVQCIGSVQPSGDHQLFPFVVNKWIFKHTCDTFVCIYCSLLQIEINVNLFIVKCFVLFFFLSIRVKYDYLCNI